MTAYPVPANERERLNELFDYSILDSPVEREFEDLVKIIAKAFGVEFAAIIFIDTKRQWVKSQSGGNNCNMSRDISICSYTILQDEVLEVEDVCQDDRFKSFPYIAGAPSFRFYAGAPLITRKGYAIGSVCITDDCPRRLDAEEQRMLQSFARSIITQLEIRLQNIELINRNAIQTRLASSLSHDIKGPLSNVKMMLDMQEETDGANASPESKVVGKLLRKGVDNTIDMVNNMIQWGKLQLNGGDAATRFDLRQLTCEALNEVCASNASKGNTLINAVPGNCMVRGDDPGIRFVLRNLLTNACKFTCGGTITVSYTATGKSPALQVKDSGIGMSPEATAKLNRKQKIGHTNGTHDETGHGLGLGLVQEYLARQNKDLYFQSLMGMGTVVSFEI